MSKKVKSITSYRSDIGAFEKDIVNPYYLFRMKEFDKNDNLINECEFRLNGSKEWETIYEYDSGKRNTCRTTLYLNEGTMEKTMYHFDESGHKIRDEYYFGDDLFEVTVYNFDKNGKIITQKRADDEENEIEKQELTYNVAGQLVKTIYYQNGDPEKQVEFNYDESGLCINEIHTNLLNHSVEYIGYSYNPEGKRKRSESKDKAGKVIGFVDIEYDDQMNPIKYTTETSGFYNSKAINEITYDEKGRAIENEYFDVLNNFLMSKEQVWFDDDGNIIEEEIFEINPQSGTKKTHYRSKLEYDFFEE